MAAQHSCWAAEGWAGGARGLSARGVLTDATDGPSLDWVGSYAGPTVAEPCPNPSTSTSTPALQQAQSAPLQAAGRASPPCRPFHPRADTLVSVGR